MDGVICLTGGSARSPGLTQAPVTRAQNWSYSGTSSLAIVTTGTGTVTGVVGMPATPGSIYTFSIYGRAATVARSFRIFIHWLDRTGALLGFRPYSGYVLNSTTTDTRQTVTGTAGAGAATVQVYVQMDDVIGQPLPATPGEVHYFDGALLEEFVTPVGTYFDGDTAGAHWSGTPHASASINQPWGI